jgi:hypothetical protein
MARVVSSKVMKSASLNLTGMSDKSRIDLNQEDVMSILHGLTITPTTNSSASLNPISSPSYVWERESPKPYALEGVIEQIKSIFNVGKEVEGWSVKYYAPAQKNEKGKPVENELRIPPVEKGLGGRFVIVVGTKEVPTLEVAVGSSGAENQYLMMDGDCIYLKITICPVLNVVFSNRHSEKLAPRKGFREMIIKKNPFGRHVFVVDAHVSMGAIANKVKTELIGITSEETVERMFNRSETASDKVAKAAAAKADSTLEKLNEVSSDISGEISESKIEKE